MNELTQKKYAALKEITTYIGSRTYLNHNLQKDIFFITKKFEEAEDYSNQLGVALPNSIYLKLCDKYFERIDASRNGDIARGEAEIKAFLHPAASNRQNPVRSLESVVLRAA